MFIKNVLIVAKSRKFNNYCVAGIDLNNGQWIRIISEDEKIKGALTEEDTTFDNGEKLQVLDKIKVPIKSKQSSWYQPENYILDRNYKIKKIGRGTSSDLYDSLENKQLLFFDKEDAILSDKLKDLQRKGTDLYSLILIKPDVLRVYLNDKGALKGSVKYQGIWYDNLLLTDTKFQNHYYEYIKNKNKSVCFKDIYMVLSLGVKFERDNKHYKIIASIIESN